MSTRAKMDNGTTQTETIQVRVLFFSVLREQVGQSALDVSLEAPATGADLLDRLTDKYPAVAAQRSTLRLAVGQEYAPESVRLEGGDEVALITPVSGG